MILVPIEKYLHLIELSTLKLLLKKYPSKLGEWSDMHIYVIQRVRASKKILQDTDVTNIKLF